MALFRILSGMALFFIGTLTSATGSFLSIIVFSILAFCSCFFFGVGRGGVDLIQCLLVGRVGGSCSGGGFSLFLLLDYLI